MAGSSDSASRFAPVFEHCAAHGSYQANALDDQGHERWVAGCPKCRQEARIRALAGQAAIPPLFQGKSLADYRAETPGQQAALQVAREFAESCLRPGHPGNLVFCGNPGTGKSHLACAAVLQAMASGRSALFLPAEKAIRTLWNPPSGKTTDMMLDAYAAIDLLILDDIGNRNTSEAGRATLGGLIETRNLAVKPLLLTSNLPLNGAGGSKPLRDFLGARAYDRLREPSCFVALFDWGSYRGSQRITPL